METIKESSINTWMRCYKVTQKTKRKYLIRLNELETWDKCNGNEYERQTKIKALQTLINERKS